ncbi:hypothetical protein [Cupriavidus pauculus]|uniref:hypothetical protein n=1 Tax=Cupriavidus pauculus TaxID=82633 RepID=UPI001FD00A9E|nr:hypothetical protein [Cupriavidus pauculus]
MPSQFLLVCTVTRLSSIGATFLPHRSARLLATVRAAVVQAETAVVCRIVKSGYRWKTSNVKPSGEYSVAYSVDTSYVDSWRPEDDGAGVEQAANIEQTIAAAIF